MIYRSLSAISFKNILYFLSGMLIFLAFFPYYYKFFYLILLISISYVLFLFLIKKEQFASSRYTSYFLLFFVFWLVYSMITILWARDGDRVLTGTLWIAIYALIFLFSIRLLEGYNGIRRFYVIIYLSSLVLFIIAIWEMITWQHLPSSRFVKSNLISFIPTGPFTNENDFASILLLNIPFYLFAMKAFKNRIVKLVSFIFFLFSVILIIIQGARIGLLICTTLFIFYFIFFVKFKYKILSIIVLVSIILLTAHFLTFEYEVFNYMLEKQISSISQDQHRSYLSSFSIRLLLIDNAVNMFINSYFFGVGTANYEANMVKMDYMRKGGIVNSHNFFFELLATNGLGIFLGFILLLLFTVVNLIKLLKLETQHKAYIYNAIFVIFAFSFSVILPSSILAYFFYWPYLAFCVSIVDKFSLSSRNDLGY